jgi:hypothetical protein
MPVKILFWVVGIFIVTVIIVASGVRDNSIKVKFNCRELELIGWRTDVPQEVVEECKKRSIK